MAPPPPDDGVLQSTISLLHRAKAGDRQALDELFARCLPPLLRWARGRLPRTARGVNDTVDVVQDAVMGTLRHLDGFEADREGALQAYLRRAVLNRIRDEYRRSTRQPPRQELHEDCGASTGPSPLEQAIGQEAIERYERALARLDPIEREAVITRFELGFSYEHVAEALGRPSAEAARHAVRRAVAHLAQEMTRDA